MNTTENGHRNAHRAEYQRLGAERDERCRKCPGVVAGTWFDRSLPEAERMWLEMGSCGDYLCNLDDA
jgi:predicted RNA-binding Zn ribbon-like protein